jgi:hypothetical protein
MYTTWEMEISPQQTRVRVLIVGTFPTGGTEGERPAAGLHDPFWNLFVLHFSCLPVSGGGSDAGFPNDLSDAAFTVAL